MPGPLQLALRAVSPFFLLKLQAEVLAVVVEVVLAVVVVLVVTEVDLVKVAASVLFGMGLHLSLVLLVESLGETGPHAPLFRSPFSFLSLLLPTQRKTPKCTKRPVY